MKTRFRLLTLVVQTTTLLLVLAATLIVVGIFNETLNWDIFGPKIEATLYGVFGTCIALASVGVALTVVLGIQAIVTSFRAIQKSHEPENTELTPDSGRWTYTKYMAAILGALVAIIAILASINDVVQKHRSSVFKKLSNEQMEHFNTRLTGLVANIKSPPRNNVSTDLHDLMKTLNDLSFVQTATLYLPDPTDTAVMWGYTAWRNYRKEDGFARFYVAKAFEKAMAGAINGQDENLNRLNNEDGFIWFYILRNDHNVPVGILRIDGNPRENFREHRLGS